MSNKHRNEFWTFVYLSIFALALAGNVYLHYQRHYQPSPCNSQQTQICEGR